MPQDHARAGASKAERLEAALYRKLKPGPGRAPEEVAAHQRARIHGAMIELVAERGYRGVTVLGLARLAGVSKPAFYKHFRDTQECFLATYDLVVRCSLQRVLTSMDGEADWRARQRLAFRALTRALAEKPRAARLVLVEALVADPAALKHRRRTVGLFEALVKDSFMQAPTQAELPPLVLEGIVAGIFQVAGARLLTGREAELPEAAEELADWAMSFQSDAASAVARPNDPFPSQGAEAMRALERPLGAPIDAICPGDERVLILSAAARLAATEGYGELTISRIRTAAGVSRKSFERHFEDVADCFLAALELHIDRALIEAGEAHATATDWATGIHRAVVSLCDRIATDPQFARIGFTGALSTGHRGMAWLAGLLGNITPLFRSSAPPEQRPSPIAAEASVGAAWGLLYHHVATGRVRRLPRIAGALSFLALAPTIGADNAADAIRLEQDRILLEDRVEAVPTLSPG